MFLKLFKYDFKAVCFKFLPILIIVPLLAVLVRILNYVKFDYFLGDLIKTLVNVMFVFCCSLLMLYGTILVILRYANSLYRNEGYLTHTLPVSKHKLLLSKILISVVFNVISCCYSIICLFIAYLSKSFINEFTLFISELLEIEITSGSVLTFILLFLLLIFVSLQGTIVIFFGIALGHTHNKHKTVMSIIYCIALNYALNIILVVPTVIFTISFSTSNVSPTFVLNLYLATTVVLSILISLGLYFSNILVMNKKLNLE